MKNPIVLIGIGEIGGVLARAFLRSGYPIYPVTRHTDIQQVAQQIPHPTLCIIAVGEKALPAVLEQLPTAWRAHCLLLQNELLPADWQRHAITGPTVMSVWFEKKPGQDVKQIIPTPVYGPQAERVLAALQTVNIEAVAVPTSKALLFELVCKNLYILTTNICGLVVGGDVETLAKEHGDLLNAVADEVIDLQEALTAQTFDRKALKTAMQTAFAGDPTHRCQGRTAAERLHRALALGDHLKLDLPKLRTLAAQYATPG